jgi:hypothetical protein
MLKELVLKSLCALLSPTKDLILAKSTLFERWNSQTFDHDDSDGEGVTVCIIGSDFGVDGP